MAVRHEDLRMVERGALVEDPLVGKCFQKGDDRIDLVRGQGRNPERLDEGAVHPLDGRYVAAAAVKIDRIMQGGAGRAADIKLLEDLCDTMQYGSLCGLGGMTPFPVVSALKHFPEDFNRNR